jgi:hypothetical protein
MLVLAVCGTLGAIAGYLWPPTHVPDHGPRQWAIMLLTGYLPALAIVLRRGARQRARVPFKPSVVVPGAEAA